MAFWCSTCSQATTIVNGNRKSNQYFFFKTFGVCFSMYGAKRKEKYLKNMRDQTRPKTLAQVLRFLMQTMVRISFIITLARCIFCFLFALPSSMLTSWLPFTGSLSPSSISRSCTAAYTKYNTLNQFKVLIISLLCLLFSKIQYFENLLIKEFLEIKKYSYTISSLLCLLFSKIDFF